MYVTCYRLFSQNFSLDKVPLTAKSVTVHINNTNNNNNINNTDNNFFLKKGKLNNNNN